MIVGETHDLGFGTLVKSDFGALVSTLGPRDLDPSQNWTIHMVTNEFQGTIFLLCYCLVINSDQKRY